MSDVRVLEWGQGYICGYAGWVLVRAGFEVHRFVDSESRPEGWLDAGKAGVEDVDLRTALEGVDLLITDMPGLLDETVPRSLPRPPGLEGLSIVALGPPAGRPDANERIAAATGVAAAIGEPDGPAQSPPGRQLEGLVGIHAAVGGLAAAVAARRDGVGEYVEIDPLQCIAGIIGVNVIQYTNYGLRWFRDGRSAYMSGGPFPFRMFRAGDGWVITLARSRAEWEAFLEMLGSPDWADDPRFADQLDIARNHAEEVSALIDEEMSRFSVAEIVDLANRLRVPLAPVRTVEEAIGDERLFDRIGDRVEPRPTIESVGEGTTFPSLVEPREPGPHGPLAGLRVLDLGWVWAAPIASAWLADLGADVVKIEARDRLDIARRRGIEYPASADAVELPGYERAMVFNAANRNKRGTVIDLKDPDDREVFFQLVSSAHVLVESFAGGVLDRLAITPADLHAVNPDLLFVSMGGASGDADFVSRSYAPILSAIAGIERAVTDRSGDPLGMPNWGGADASGGSWGLFSVVAAVARGVGGVHMRVSQLRGVANTCAALYTEGAGSRAVSDLGFDPEEITSDHFEGNGSGVSGELFRAVTVHSWHPKYGIRIGFDSPWRFSRTPVGVRRGAPLLGETPSARIIDEWTKRPEEAR